MEPLSAIHDDLSLEALAAELGLTEFLNDVRPIPAPVETETSRK